MDLTPKDIRIVLGIESSCDETSVAVIEDGTKVLSNIVSSQIDLHRQFGGVVPELASRKHIEAIMPVIELALQEADVRLADIDGVAVTYGPGLVGALLVGLSAAKGLAFSLDRPFIGVNHIEGHIYANFLERPEVKPPVICLTVSGGHTDLLYIHDYGQYEILGRTRDDAAGEAMDKIARVMGLPYPGGPEIDRVAVTGDPQAVRFPRALRGEMTYDFSFSGVKTAAINWIHNARQKGEEINVADLAASFQQAIVESLVEKTIAAAQSKQVRRIILSGGVAANSQLRKQLNTAATDMGMEVYYPHPKLCTDNAAMIACVGYYRLRRGDVSPMALNAVPNLRLE